jgi:regulator of cell morphogenesis and NO signaling
MSLLCETAADVVIANPGCARVFRKYRIDFSSARTPTVAEAAAVRGIDPLDLEGELEDAARASANYLGDLSRLSCDVLVERIVSKFHRQIRSASLPLVTTLAGRVARLHGAQLPLFRKLDQSVLALAAELSEHTAAEEAVLFPAIVDGGNDRATIERALLAMYDEHVVVRELLLSTRAITDALDGVTGPSDVYGLLRQAFDALELEVLVQIHAENHVLLPRCLLVHH